MLRISANSCKQEERWQCMCILGVIADLPYSSVDRLHMPSAIIISVDEMENFTRSLPASKNFFHHSICEGDKKSPRQKYIIQLFHCCAVRKWPVLIETKSHPCPDGTIVLSLVSTFNNASGERTLQPIHMSLANAWPLQEIDCASGLSIAFLFSAFWLVALSLCLP